MHQGEIWLQEQQARHARAERSRIHLHRQAIEEAQRAERASSPIRRRLGESIIRLGHRVAGERLGSPALTG
jgi:hypothetical protein